MTNWTRCPRCSLVAVPGFPHVCPGPGLFELMVDRLLPGTYATSTVVTEPPKEQEMEEILAEVLRRHWIYEGAHKTCNHCGESVGPGVSASEIQHTAGCPVTRYRVLSQVGAMPVDDGLSVATADRERREAIEQARRDARRADANAAEIGKLQTYIADLTKHATGLQEEVDKLRRAAAQTCDEREELLDACEKAGSGFDENYASFVTRLKRERDVLLESATLVVESHLAGHDLTKPMAKLNSDVIRVKSNIT